MATCRFPGCDAMDVGEALPPGWTLVLFETRKLDETWLEVERRRTLLCPEHGQYVAQLCGLVPPAACADADDETYCAHS